MIKNFKERLAVISGLAILMLLEISQHLEYKQLTIR